MEHERPLPDSDPESTIDPGPRQGVIDTLKPLLAGLVILGVLVVLGVLFRDEPTPTGNSSGPYLHQRTARRGKVATALTVDDQCLAGWVGGVLGLRVARGLLNCDTVRFFPIPSAWFWRFPRCPCPCWP